MLGRGNRMCERPEAQKRILEEPREGLGGGKVGVPREWLRRGPSRTFSGRRERLSPVPPDNGRRGLLGAHWTHACTPCQRCGSSGEPWRAIYDVASREGRDQVCRGHARLTPVWRTEL